MVWAVLDENNTVLELYTRDSILFINSAGKHTLPNSTTGTAHLSAKHAYLGVPNVGLVVYNHLTQTFEDTIPVTTNTTTLFSPESDELMFYDQGTEYL